jgi:hypothetical protein
VRIRVSRFKSLRFRKNADGGEISKNVPSNLNQALVSKIDFDDYLIRIVAVSRVVAESEFATFLDGKRKYVGCLIPGNSILSDESPNNENPLFAAYSLIVAARVCLSSFSDDFELAGVGCQGARDMDEVFASGFYYAVFQKSKLKLAPRDFDSTYYASLFSSGLILSAQKHVPRLALGPSVFAGDIVVQPNKQHPAYIYEIIINLIPYTESPFLRFFYLYQTIEYLMSEWFQSNYAEVKAKLDKETNISVTTLRDFVQKLDQSMKESTRINDVLQPSCPSTQLEAEQILDALAVDRSGLSFAGLIYKIRNIVFHDFRQIHHLSEEIGALSDSLLRYIVEKKIL